MDFFNMEKMALLLNELIKGYPNLSLIIFLGLLVVTISTPFIISYFIKRITENKNMEEIYKVSNNSNIDIKEARETLSYINELIQEKFNYHLHSKLLPIYVSDKIPDKNTIVEIKEYTYLSITASISPAMKKLIRKYFSQKGIEILIHERIMTLINEVDFTLTKNKSVNQNFKDIKPKDITKLL